MGSHRAASHVSGCQPGLAHWCVPVALLPGALLERDKERVVGIGNREARQQVALDGPCAGDLAVCAVEITESFEEPRALKRCHFILI